VFERLKGKVDKSEYRGLNVGKVILGDGGNASNKEEKRGQLIEQWKTANSKDLWGA